MEITLLIKEKSWNCVFEFLWEPREGDSQCLLKPPDTSVTFTHQPLKSMLTHQVWFIAYRKPLLHYKQQGFYNLLVHLVCCTQVLYTRLHTITFASLEIIIFISHPKYMLWVPLKNRLDETVLLSTHSICLI